jgi:hypothetical protein
MGRLDEDTAKVKDILNITNIEQMPIIYRMGKREPAGRPRLVKLHFPTRKAARDLLKNKNALQTKFKGLKLRPSMSFEERAQHKALSAECTKKRADGGDYVVFDANIMLRTEINAYKAKKSNT